MPPRKRFILSGHSAVLDPSIYALRNDLADVELADRVFAPHYARAMACTVTKITTVHVEPNYDTTMVDQLTTGTILDLFDVSAGWGWVLTAKTVGYIHTDCIAPL